MPNEIRLSLHPRVDALRAAGGQGCSSHAFPSLYLWRDEMGLTYWEKDGAFAVRAQAAGPNVWLFPCGAEAGRRAFLAAHAAEPDLTLRYLRAEDAAWLDATEPGRWALTRTPNDDEYLYDRAAHLAMAGHAFASMRQRFRRLERRYAVRPAPLTDENLPDAQCVLERWAARARSGPNPFADPVADAALAARAALGMQGLLLYLDEAPAALLLGFMLTQDTFDVVVGKCAVQEQGLTYYALHALCAALPPEVHTLDLEEDLGLPGLRGMKENYLPDARHKFWEARRR